MITDFKKLPKDWKQIISDLMSNGAHQVEVMRELGVNYRTHAKFIKEHEDYRDAIEEGKLLSEAWWFRTGRENLNNKKSFDTTGWIFTMKAVFGLRETVSVDTKGSALPRKEDEIVLLEKYKVKEEKEKEVEVN